MKFTDLFLPKWKRSDPEIRRKGIEDLLDQHILFKIIREDNSDIVRIAAAKKSSDVACMLDVVYTHPDSAVRMILLDKIMSKLLDTNPPAGSEITNAVQQIALADKKHGD